MHLQFVGCGDAFGSGGRFNTCFHLVGKKINALIDCGATSLVAMNKLAINLSDINTIFLTHFHADHVGGLPFFLLELHYVLKRQRGLTVAGPPSLKSRYGEIMETAFPGTKTVEWSFPLTLSEMEIGKRNEIGNLRITPFHVVHDDRAGLASDSVSKPRARSSPFPATPNGRKRSSTSVAAPICSSARPIRATSRSRATWR